MSIKLHAPLGHGRTNKILVTAALAHVPVELVNTQLNDKNIQVFQQSFPFGKVPVLETTEGNLFESNAILRFLARQSQGLYGTSPYQQGLVDQWLDATINELESDAVAAAVQVLGYIPANPTQFQSSLQNIGHTLQIVNTQLVSHKFITGATLTVADICLAQVVSFVFTYLVGEEQRNKLPQLLTWLNVVTALPEWQAQFGRSRFVKTPFGIKEEAKSK